VHDVKNLKLKLRADEERKFNSPWNIAVDFKIDMSLHPENIEPMLIEYCTEHGFSFDTKTFSDKLYYYTHGYPFLVSKLCKIIDEELMEDSKRPWTSTDLEKAVRILVRERNTLFDDLIKNLEHYHDLYAIVYRIVIVGDDELFSPHDPIIELGMLYGILRQTDEHFYIDNFIFEQVIYDYMLSKKRRLDDMHDDRYRTRFMQDDNSLDMKLVLRRFQQFMKEQYSSKDADFLERNGRLLFLAFVKPIINGSGYDFKEPQISEERRLDIVITFNQFRYVVELKIWRGEKAHERGLKQLHGYLENLGLNEGYLLIFDTSANKVYTEEQISVDGKEIFVVRT
jgi:hypothetical protein